MKRNIYFYLLIAEAALCLAFTILQTSFTGAFSTMMAFPWEQIGLGLRALSLSGGLGNAAAVAIYTAVCLSPAIILLCLRLRRKLFPEDGLLVLLSITLFAALYLMINPGLLGLAGGAAGIVVGKALLGGAVYSVFCGYLILRAVRSFFHSDAKALARHMSVLLGIAGAIFIYIAFGSRLNDLLSSIAALQAGNVGNEHGLWISFFILAFGYIADIIPYLLNVVIVFSALDLLGALRVDRYSEAAVAASVRLSRRCGMALTATVSLNIAYNLIQLFIINLLRSINITVSLSIFPIMFILVALLLTRFVSENKQLKDENDAFI